MEDQPQSDDVNKYEDEGGERQSFASPFPKSVQYNGNGKLQSFSK